MLVVLAVEVPVGNRSGTGGGGWVVKMAMGAMVAQVVMIILRCSAPGAVT